MEQNIKLKVFAFDAGQYPQFHGKCLECNNETSVLYVLAKSKDEARRLVDAKKDGVCANCMVARITKGQIDISKDI